MADFDFDELDRAVAGALNTTPSSAQPASPVSTPDGAPVTPTSEPVSPQPSTPAPATRRTSGRFMDMVHPASDMRTSRPETTPTTESVPSATPLDPAPVADPFTSSFEDLPRKADENSKPLESPFLPDAKVEKRPLGGVGIFPPETPAQADPTPTPVPTPAPFIPTEPGELPVDTSDPHVMPDPIDFALQNQPEEVKEESSQAAVSEEKAPSPDTSTAPELSEKPFVDAEPAQLEEQLASIEAESIELPSEVDTTHPRPEAPAAADSSESAPSGPTSITQQYKEQPSSTVESGAIFDTEAYHQPLVHHAAKKKSSVWIILGILALVLVGAGAGVAFYLYILPTL